MSDHTQSTPALWSKGESTLHADCKVFDVLKVRWSHPAGKVADFYTVKASDWAVALARTVEGRYVMIQQFRFGSESLSWEFPAGCIDSGEDPAAAAARELQEETGYTGSPPILLGISHPNPALQTNHCYFYLIEEARKTHPTGWDEHEEMDIVERTEAEIGDMVRAGKVSHAIALNALLYLKL